MDDWEDELPVSDYSGTDSAEGDEELDQHEAAFMEGYEEANSFEGDDNGDGDLV